MGLDYHGIRTLAYAKALDPGLDSIAMLGRQSLHTNTAAIGDIFREFGIPCPEGDLQRMIREGEGYCEPLLRHMGFGHIDSFDFNGYEKPTHIHDFNQPIPAEFELRYDLVLDGGSLEHIFNFPTALRNCMSMARMNGMFISCTPCNNQCGHGFYQFSPELYFSLLRGYNGYMNMDIFCHEITPGALWFRVKDPYLVKNRVNMLTWKPIMMVVMARRTENGPLPPFRIQQSDYETVWAGASLQKIAPNNRDVRFAARIRRLMRRFVPIGLLLRVRELIGPESFPPEFFTPAHLKEGREAVVIRKACQEP
jgi:hypothetical protein